MRNEEEKESREGGGRPWPGRRVIQMKLEAYEMCFFFSRTQMHIPWPHLLTDHQSETERVWEGRRQRSHIKRERLFFFCFCYEQSTIVPKKKIIQKFDPFFFFFYCEIYKVPPPLWVFFCSQKVSREPWFRNVPWIGSANSDSGQNEPYSYENWHSRDTSHTWTFTSYNMFTVLKYAINEILTV